MNFGLDILELGSNLNTGVYKTIPNLPERHREYDVHEYRNGQNSRRGIEKDKES